jgi:hypothetical protein
MSARLQIDFKHLHESIEGLLHKGQVAHERFQARGVQVLASANRAGDSSRVHPVAIGPPLRPSFR